MKYWYLFFFLGFASAVQAQDNYEIQVYGAELVKPRETILELHSNYTLNGFKQYSPDGMVPTQHVVHETIEITHGFTPWLEVGVYMFNSLGSDASGTPRLIPHLPKRFRDPIRTD